MHALDVYEVVAAGNTTMMHLLLGVDPRAIAQAPYVAGWREGIEVNASDVGLKICRFGRLIALPNIAGFVGADTVAVVLATDMHHSDDLALAIDIGTNGEIVLGTQDNLIACSTAAGPAFEGARIKFGMRAAAGAIERVDIDGNIPPSPHQPRARRQGRRPLRHRAHRHDRGTAARRHHRRDRPHALGRRTARVAAGCGRTPCE